jgi:FMN phosphatase YigB (HAD superfamily)
MAKSLAEYIDWLDERPGLVWPQPPAVKPLKATPFLKPLPGIRALTWELYGTLLRIDTGRLHLLHPQPLRMQIALQKTIEEFNFWNSMSRKPGQPWEYLLRQYTEVVENLQLTTKADKGDVPHIDAAQVWEKLIERLTRNEYEWDRGLYGDLDELAHKVAYFFHSSLQGVAAADGVVDLQQRLLHAGIRQGLLADAHSFSVAQTVRAFRRLGSIAAIGDVVSPGCQFLSCTVHARKPSPSLYRHAVEQFGRMGIGPSEVLHVTHRLEDDLVAAKQAGLRTALVVADANCTQVDKDAVRDPASRPDRLLTNLAQLPEVLGI